MDDVKASELHISSILGQMVKKWCEVLPAGVRALEKFNRENNGVLVKTGAEKAEIMAFLKLKNFKGTASGARVDLSIYTQVFEPLNTEALSHKTATLPKGGL
jgi:hypothetical protein